MSYRFEVARREVQRIEAKLSKLRMELAADASLHRGRDQEPLLNDYDMLVTLLCSARIEEARWRP